MRAPGLARRRAVALALLLGMAASIALVQAGLVPALYQALLVLGGLVLGTAAPQLVVRGPAARKAARAAGAVATALFLAELTTVAVYRTGIIWPPTVRFRDGERTMTRESVLLGFRPDVADGAVRAVKRRPDGSVVYDVTYTLRDGLRATKGDPAGPCTVAFMIDSVAFGDGVGDEDTLPQRFSEATGFRLNVVNLGFSSYGPQQMLASIEGGRLDRYVRAPLAAAYYVTTDDHVLRLSGLTDWSRFDPRYALIGGQVIRTGRFHVFPSLASLAQFRRDLPGFLSASSAFHWLVRRWLPDLPDRIPAARALYVETLTRASALLRARHGVPLTVLVWNAETLTKPALAELARRGMEIIPYEAFTGPLTDRFRIRDDGHPSPLANRIVAQGLAKRFPGCPPR